MKLVITDCSSQTWRRLLPLSSFQALTLISSFDNHFNFQFLKCALFTSHKNMYNQEIFTRISRWPKCDLFFVIV